MKRAQISGVGYVPLALNDALTDLLADQGIEVVSQAEVACGCVGSEARSPSQVPDRRADGSGTRRVREAEGNP